MIMDAFSTGLQLISDDDVREIGAAIAGVWARPLQIRMPDAWIKAETAAREAVAVEVAWDAARAEIGGAPWVHPLYELRTEDAAFITRQDVLDHWATGYRYMVNTLLKRLGELDGRPPTIYTIRFAMRRPLDAWLPVEMLHTPDAHRVCRLMGYPLAGENGAV